MSTPLGRVLAARRRGRLPLLLALMLAAAPRMVASISPSDSTALVRAERLFRLGRPDSTLAIVDPILERTTASDDPRLRMLALLHRASALGVTGRSSDAETASQEALRLARALGDSAHVMMAQRWRAFALLGRGNTAEAGLLYEELLMEAERAANVGEAAYAQLGLGYLALRHGDSERALPLYRLAARRFDRVGEIGMALDARIGAARCLRQLGRFAEMRQLYEEILARDPDPSTRRPRAAALNNLGAYEFEAGDPSLAVRYWTQALAEIGPASDVASRITPASNLALAWMEMGAFDDASAVLSKLLEECERAGNRTEVANVLLLLASIESAHGQYALGVATYDSVLAMRDASPVAKAAAAVGTARALERLGRSPEIPAILTRWQSELGASLPANWRLEFDLLLGESLRSSSQWTQARDAAIASETAATLLGLRSPRMRALLLRARCERALDRPDSAMASLRRAQALWEDLRAVPRDPQWREQRGALGREIHLELATLYLKWPSDEAETSRVATAFDLLQRHKSRTLRERMDGPDRFESASAVEPVRLEELQSEVLGPGELLLDCYLGDPISLVFAVSRDGLEVHHLPASESIRERIRLSRPLAADPNPNPHARAATWWRAAARLGDELWGPLAASIRASSTLIIAGDGPLLALPLERMFGNDGTAPDMEIFRVPSATVLAALRAGSADDFQTAGLRILGLTDGDDLSGARDELELLRRRYRQVHGVAQCPDSTALASWDRVAILHLAGHADVLDQRPWASRMRLGEDARGEACYLYGADLARMRLPVELAVMAGCDTGSGRFVTGEGVLGLSTAFLGAGAKVVVATLWPVDDAVTAWFMQEFYDGLADGASVAGALLAAQESVRHHPSTAHPAYWAGFVAIGDATRGVALSRRSPGMVRPALLGGLLLVTAGVLLRRARTTGL